MVHQDGNGWASCDRGHTHWGRHGAAGLLLHAVDDEGHVRVLLQHRAAWSHHGGTWGLPGGARDSHEDVIGAALREAVEEAGLDRASVRTRHTFVDDHGGWSYTTVHADTPVPLATTANRESEGLEWVRLDDVAGRALHPGFAATWSQVRARSTIVLVDTANVLGTRPDGWWRDRAGATTRLLEQLEALRAATVDGPGGAPQVVSGVAAVLEGAATRAAAPPWVQPVRPGDRAWSRPVAPATGRAAAGPGAGNGRSILEGASGHPPAEGPDRDTAATPGRPARRGAGGHGDDLMVAAAARLLADGADVLAVTADRGLRARLEGVAVRSPIGSLQLAGPRWLLGLLDGGGPQAS